MAIKQRDEQPKSKLIEVLTTEYRWENLLLGILALTAAAIAALILTKTLNINDSFPVLGKGNNGVIFAWFLLIISLFGVFLVIYPFFVPAWPEMRKITWPTAKKFWENVLRTVIFTGILMLMLLLFDALIIQTLGRLF